jgi:hypothetical protein
MSWKFGSFLSGGDPANLLPTEASRVFQLVHALMRRRLMGGLSASIWALHKRSFGSGLVT